MLSTTHIAWCYFNLLYIRLSATNGWFIIPIFSFIFVLTLIGLNSKDCACAYLNKSKNNKL